MATCRGCFKMGYPLQSGFCRGCRGLDVACECKGDRERGWNFSNRVQHRDPPPLLGDLQYPVAERLRRAFPLRRMTETLCDCQKCKETMYVRGGSESPRVSRGFSVSPPRGFDGFERDRQKEKADRERADRARRNQYMMERDFDVHTPITARQARPRTRGRSGGPSERGLRATSATSGGGNYYRRTPHGYGARRQRSSSRTSSRGPVSTGRPRYDDRNAGYSPYPPRSPRDHEDEEVAYRKLWSAFQTIRGAVLEQQQRDQEEDLDWVPPDPMSRSPISPARRRNASPIY
ncbi:hypothetical protein DIPPA_35734 [Diplonema papillatum]|nr:hypothetical protein DIPPA_35734 [Diplonema papillatum]